ncbi:MAG: EipB family protein [Propylenella sp.]
MLNPRSTLVALAAPLALGATAAHGQAAPSLRDIIAPHRAIYDIKLARTENGSGVSSASGRMVFEVTGNACQGYSMRQRMVVNIGDEDGNLGKLDFQISTFESGAGDLYTFDSRTTMNEEVVEAVEGAARRRDSAIEVTLKRPAEKTVLVDGGALFPSQHLQAIIDAARGDQEFLSVDIYEGAGTGESSDEAAAAIGRATRTRADNLIGGGLRQWPVSIGYFDAEGVSAEHAGEELPTYQMSFMLYENGVTSDLVMDYGDYALLGSLQEIERLASSNCASP